MHVNGNKYSLYNIKEIYCLYVHVIVYQIRIYASESEQSLLVKIMACRLAGANPSCIPTLMKYIVSCINMISAYLRNAR